MPRFLICSSLNLRCARSTCVKVFLASMNRISSFFLCLRLVFIKEPERGRQGNRGEHIGGQRHHLADDALFDHLFADLVLALACVGGRVCHDQRRLAVLIQGRGKVADPQVVGVGNRFFLVGGFFRRLGGVAGNAVGIEARITADTVKETSSTLKGGFAIT